MVIETRKLHIIEKLLKLKSETVLTELEVILDKATKLNKNRKFSARDFSEIVSNDDAKLIEAAIEEGCEQIHPDDWK